MERRPDLRNLPEWVKSFGLPPEAGGRDRPLLEAGVGGARRLRCCRAPARGARAPQPPAGRRAARLRGGRGARRRARRGRPRFDAMWPAYRAWYLQDGERRPARPRHVPAALERHMPELVPTYERLVELAGGDELAARLLSLYRPPGFIVGCSQGAWTRDAPGARAQLRLPGRAARGHRLPDGVDRPPGDRDERLPVGPARRDQRRRPRGLARPSAGAATSATASASRSSCATCSRPATTVARGARGARARSRSTRPEPHAARPLGRVPDRLRRAPAARPSSATSPATTNHQGRVEWPEYARAIRSVERERCVLDLLADPEIDRERFVDRSSSRRCTTPSYAPGLRHDLHRRVLPGRGPGRVPLARLHLGAVVRPLRGDAAHGDVHPVLNAMRARRRRSFGTAVPANCAWMPSIHASARSVSRLSSVCMRERATSTPRSAPG